MSPSGWGSRALVLLALTACAAAPPRTTPAAETAGDEASPSPLTPADLALLDRYEPLARAACQRNGATMSLVASIFFERPEPPEGLDHDAAWRVGIARILADGEGDDLRCRDCTYAAASREETCTVEFGRVAWTLDASGAVTRETTDTDLDGRPEITSVWSDEADGWRLERATRREADGTETVALSRRRSHPIEGGFTEDETDYDADGTVDMRTRVREDERGVALETHADVGSGAAAQEYATGTCAWTSATRYVCDERIGDAVSRRSGERDAEGRVVLVEVDRGADGTIDERVTSTWSGDHVAIEESSGREMGTLVPRRRVIDDGARRLTIDRDEPVRIELRERLR